MKCRNSLYINIFRKNWSEKDGRSFSLFATLSEVPRSARVDKRSRATGDLVRRHQIDDVSVVNSSKNETMVSFFPLENQDRRVHVIREFS